MRIVQLIIMVLAFGAFPIKGMAIEKGTLLDVNLPRTGQIISYDSQGNEIDYKNSGQDGEFQRGLPWPEPRFSYNGDGTVTDNMTGLVWLKDGNCFDKLSWHSAGKSIERFNKNARLGECVDYTASFADWSMPTLDELASLLNADEKVVANYLNLQGFSAMQSSLYWTGSKYMNSFNAWAIDLAEGGVMYRGKMEKHFLVPVRHSELEKPKLASKDTAKNEGQISDEISRRFIDNGDGTISDSKTNLMWLKDAGCFPQVLWQGALDAIAAFNQHQLEGTCQEYHRDYDDWTLPNRVELRSLVDYNHDFPALTPEHPFQNIGSTYWTSTSDAAEPRMSFGVDLYSGMVVAHEKTTRHSAWPVRDVVATSPAPRKVAHSGIGAEIAEEFVMDIIPEMRTALRWPPEPRFFNNGDGTSMDRITGITWLSDGGCFNKLSWKETFETVADFNSNPGEFGCEGYDATFGDWRVPKVVELRELINPLEKDSALWLNGQGVSNIQSGGDYWSATETVINLYYANVISLKTGIVRNYPKSLKFFFWPHRALPRTLSREPLLNITVNAVSDSVTVEQGTPFTVSLYLHTFGLQTDADFWVWYDAPDGQQVWLSGIRTWQSSMTPVYQADLFNLKKFDIIMVKNSALATGDYILHFAVDFEKNGILDNMRFENQVVVSIRAKE